MKFCKKKKKKIDTDEYFVVCSRRITSPTMTKNQTNSSESEPQLSHFSVLLPTPHQYSYCLVRDSFSLFPPPNPPPVPTPQHFEKIYDDSIYYIRRSLHDIHDELLIKKLETLWKLRFKLLTL